MRMARRIQSMYTFVDYYQKPHFSSTHLPFIPSENLCSHPIGSPLHRQLNQRVSWRFCEFVFFQKRLPIEWIRCLWRSLDRQIRDRTTVRIAKIFYYQTCKYIIFKKSISQLSPFTFSRPMLFRERKWRRIDDGGGRPSSFPSNHHIKYKNRRG